MSELALADAIDNLRRELGRAVEAGKGEQLQFKLGPVELELQVDLSMKGGGKAEVKWVVVSLGGDASTERVGRHKVKLTLTPQLDGKGDVIVSDKRTYRED